MIMNHNYLSISCSNGQIGYSIHSHNSEMSLPVDSESQQSINYKHHQLINTQSINNNNNSSHNIHYHNNHKKYIRTKQALSDIFHAIHCNCKIFEKIKSWYTCLYLKKKKI
eukprot:140768_1